MRKSLTSVAVCVAMSSILSSCNNSPKTSADLVTTGFAITGSGQNAVAQSGLQNLFSAFIPSAMALTPPLLIDSTGLAVNLNDAWIVVKEIEFESNETPGVGEVDGNETEFQGPFYVDLLSTSPVSFGDAQVPASNLRRVKMKLHEADSIPGSAPAGLNGKSIFFSGTVNGVAFDYAADDSTELEIGGPNPIVPNSSQDMLAVIRMADLFKKIDLSSIVAPTSISTSSRVPVANACPLIDASANDLYTCFRKGLASEANFGNDNGDMDLDSNDDSVE